MRSKFLAVTNLSNGSLEGHLTPSIWFRTKKKDWKFGKQIVRPLTFPIKCKWLLTQLIIIHFISQLLCLLLSHSLAFTRCPQPYSKTNNLTENISSSTSICFKAIKLPLLMTVEPILRPNQIKSGKNPFLWCRESKLLNRKSKKVIIRVASLGHKVGRALNKIS